MKLPVLGLVAALTVVGATWLASSAAPAADSGILYTFRESPLHALGLKNLDELRGTPIVIDFWGKN
ncbi:MAG: hypothetical protein IPJ77_24200 [Planctomycetes bacterium]|nr:hypothetical protein [Planctomycetota bacterium]